MMTIKQNKWNIPVLEIITDKNNYWTGNQLVGYLSVFRNYRCQISATAEGETDLGSSHVSTNDFHFNPKDAVQMHLRECIENNSNNVYNLGITIDDIPREFIDASIEASKHWDELIKGKYTPTYSFPKA